MAMTARSHVDGYEAINMLALTALSDNWSPLVDR